MRDLTTTARWLVAAAAAGDEPPATLKAAAADLYAALRRLSELEARTPRAHLALLVDVEALARAVARCNGDHLLARAQFRHWSHAQWYARLALFRAQQNSSEGGLPAATQERPRMAKKSVPLKTAADPQPQRYAAGKPATPASIETRPTGIETASTGDTGGNFKLPEDNTGAGFPQHGIDGAK